MKKNEQKINPWMIVAGCVAFLYAIWASRNSLCSSAWDSAAVMLALGALVQWRILRRPSSRVPFTNNTGDLFISYLLLGAFWGLFLLPNNALSPDWRFSIGLTLILLAPICYYAGRKNMLFSITPIFIFCAVIPQQEQIFLLMSAPLRLLATMISAETLKLFGCQITYNLTSIRLPEVELAITDACSGIEQFEAMLLLGYIMVIYAKRRLSWSILHYLFIVPSVLLANSIRLILVVKLFYSIGEKVLDSGWHQGMGYFQVCLTLVFFWLAGKGIDAMAVDDPHEKSKEAAK